MMEQFPLTATLLDIRRAWREVDRMMAGQRSFAQNIQTLFDTGSVGELTDRQLLEQFTRHGADMSEFAFEVLLKRHGPMVLRTCTAILGDRHEAEDATQATFLVLARKARSLWVRDSLGPWLFGVARRIASSARTAALRRRVQEQRSAKSETWKKEDSVRDESDAIVHEEVNRLPQVYRAAVVLCDLEGLTQEQAALQLGWPAGTVRSRLSRGRSRLRERLIRRGLGPSAATAAGSVRGETSLFLLPKTVAEATIQAAMPSCLGQPVAGATSSAIALMEGVLKVMFWNEMKLVTTAFLCGAVILGGSAVIGRRALAYRGPQKGNAKAQAETLVTQAPELKREPASRPSVFNVRTANEQARLDVAKKIRDAMAKRFAARGVDLMTYLRWEKRYKEIELDTARTDADKLRIYESQVALMKQIEQASKGLYRNGMIAQTDMFVAELERLDAEVAVEKLKARIGSERGPDRQPTP
jgi:RNA polymerase sigma factor (sigma-70 family)